MTRRALKLIGSRRDDRYEAGLRPCGRTRADGWSERLACDPEKLDEGEVPYRADADHLQRFIETQVLAWCRRRRTELKHRSLISDQLRRIARRGELEVLARYEVHLDSKLEMMLTMLVRLKDLREAARVLPEAADEQ